MFQCHQNYSNIKYTFQGVLSLVLVRHQLQRGTILQKILLQLFSLISDSAWKFNHHAKQRSFVGKLSIWRSADLLISLKLGYWCKQIIFQNLGKTFQDVFLWAVKSENQKFIILPATSIAHGFPSSIFIEFITNCRFVFLFLTTRHISLK